MVEWCSSNPDCCESNGQDLIVIIAINIFAVVAERVYELIQKLRYLSRLANFSFMIQKESTPSCKNTLEVNQNFRK